MALIKKRSRKSGMAPGSLVYVGEQKVEKTRISLIDFGPDEVAETSPGNWSECQPYLSSESVTWINVTGLGNSEQLTQIG